MEPARWREPTVLIDCDSCTARDLACDDCVVSVMLGPVAGLELDDTEHRALEALAEGGLVPRLRLTVADDGSNRSRRAAG
jgi:hypothetical protein